jgi:hypothetical protein
MEEGKKEKKDGRKKDEEKNERNKIRREERPDMGPAYPSVQWVSGYFSLQECESDHSPPSSAEI